MAKEPATKNRRHIRPILLEGLTLHIRTIIEQGRSTEFLTASKEAGFETLKAQVGFVSFVRDFVNAGKGKQRNTPITGADAQKFLEATWKSPGKIDICL